MLFSDEVEINFASYELSVYTAIIDTLLFGNTFSIVLAEILVVFMWIETVHLTFDRLFLWMFSVAWLGYYNVFIEIPHLNFSVISMFCFCFCKYFSVISQCSHEIYRIGFCKHFPVIWLNHTTEYYMQNDSYLGCSFKQMYNFMRTQSKPVLKISYISKAGTI